MSDSVWPHRQQPPGSPVPGILQARTLEWVVISFSNAWKWKVKAKSISRVRLLVTPWNAAYQAPPSMGFSRQEYWSGVLLPSPRRKLRDPLLKSFLIAFPFFFFFALLFIEHISKLYHHTFLLVQANNSENKLNFELWLMTQSYQPKGTCI